MTYAAHSPVLNIRELRAQLALRAIAQWQLAVKLDICPSSFSAYVTGRARAPADFVERIERELRLDPGTLKGPSTRG